MANKHRGEVSFRALDQEWTIRLGTNALCEWETETGRSVNELGQADNFSLGMLRALFRYGMLEFHPEISVQDAGNIIDDLGFEEAAKIVQRASALGMPEAEKTARPRQAKARPN